MQNNRQEYINALAKVPKASIFFQPWWLDAVCDKEWEVLFARDKGGNVIGFMPYWKIKKWGMPVIIQPPLTPHLGIQIILPHNIQKQDAKLSFEKKVCDQIIDQIPSNFFFSQMFHLGFKNWLPFYWKNYKQTTRYTYKIKDITSTKKVYDNLKGSVRTDIKKAKPLIKLRKSNTINDHYQLVLKSFQKHNDKPTFSLQLIKGLDTAIQANSQRLILIAEYNELAAASIYIVYDKETCYLLGIGHDNNINVKGIIQLLVWEGIQRANKVVRSFDFEGSMVYNFEKVFRAFGGAQQPYFHIFKYKNLIYQLGHSLIK